MGASISPVLGIDLGTTNSACAVVQDGRACVVRRGEDRIVPSVVALRGTTLMVGQKAKAYRVIEPEKVVFSAKRLIGRRFSSSEVQRMRSQVPYKLVEGPNDSVLIDLGDGPRTVVEFSSYILQYLREMAQEALGEAVTRAVIAVPANFTDSQRSATRSAASLAGLDVMRLINEPTAAALAYGYIEDTDRRIAVYDLGGGTFDLTILQITRNVFEVLATAGDMFLGGDDVDLAVLDLMIADFRRQHGRDVRQNRVAVERLRAVAEELKIKLSETTRASILVEDVLGDGSHDLEFNLSDADLRARAEPLVRKTVNVCHDALREAGLSPDQIDEIVLVGGSTRMPLVREVVTDIFGKVPHTTINPMSVVAVGAAIQGAALTGSLVPMAGSSDRGTSSAPRAAVLIDVTPRSLGVRTVGGFVDVIIDRNSAIPVEQTRVFTTTHDDQRFVRIQVCQGESETFAENTKLGEVVFTELRPAPRGTIAIAVTFEINTDGLLAVRAVDQDTRRQQQATMRVLGVADGGSTGRQVGDAGEPRIRLEPERGGEDGAIALR